MINKIELVVNDESRESSSISLRHERDFDSIYEKYLTQ